MAVRLATRMADLKASEIREILKLTQRPEVISFAGGLPAPELFPATELGRLSSQLLDVEGARMLQYSTTEGDPELRRRIADRMNAVQGTTVAADQILVTCGSQQGLDLTGRLLLDAGDVVLCESPTYIGAINAFKAYRPRFVEVATDDDGMLPGDLELRLREEDRARLIYVVPNFQNPTGRTWSRARREALLELAVRHSLPVIEDNPYGEVCFEGETPPSLLSLDRAGLVVHLGTFSKVFCPGLRLGWLAASRALFEKYVLLKQGVDLHTSTFSQRLLASYLRCHGLDAGLVRIRSTYRGRRDAMLAALEAEMPSEVRWTRPRGGLFLWLELPAELDARVLLEHALQLDVAFVPGGSFFPNGGHENTMRLNFSAMPEDRITEGVRRLAQVVRHALREVPAAV